jgi:hypothetical protein
MSPSMTLYISPTICHLTSATCHLQKKMFALMDHNVDPIYSEFEIVCYFTSEEQARTRAIGVIRKLLLEQQKMENHEMFLLGKKSIDPIEEKEIEVQEIDDQIIYTVGARRFVLFLTSPKKYIDT